jgi:transcriptional regulator with XRE-family HTH domain
MWNYWARLLHKIKLKMCLSELKKMCSERGISIGQVFDDIGINRSVLSRWEKKEPKSILTYQKIYERIATIPKRSDN